jgi:hypothetical protein
VGSDNVTIQIPQNAKFNPEVQQEWIKDNTVGKLFEILLKEQLLTLPKYQARKLILRFHFDELAQAASDVSDQDQDQDFPLVGL